MEEFVKVLKIEIAKAFDSEDYERKNSYSKGVSE